jgi:hypothetical protein
MFSIKIGPDFRACTARPEIFQGVHTHTHALWFRRHCTLPMFFKRMNTKYEYFTVK